MALLAGAEAPEADRAIDAPYRHDGGIRRECHRTAEKFESTIERALIRVGSVNEAKAQAQTRLHGGQHSSVWGKRLSADRVNRAGLPVKTEALASRGFE